VTLKDEKDFYKGFVDYEIIRHLNGRVPWPYPKTGVHDYLIRHLPNQGKTEWMWGLFLKDHPDKLIGSISLYVSDVTNRGFWLRRQDWGHGYMTEAAEAVNKFAVEELGFEKLLFNNAKGNHRSCRIKEKTGARLVRIDPVKAVDPQYTEAEYWELTKEEWQKQHDKRSKCEIDPC